MGAVLVYTVRKGMSVCKVECTIMHYLSMIMKTSR